MAYFKIQSPATNPPQLSSNGSRSEWGDWSTEGHSQYTRLGFDLAFAERTCQPCRTRVESPTKLCGWETLPRQRELNDENERGATVRGGVARHRVPGAVIAGTVVGTESQAADHSPGAHRRRVSGSVHPRWQDVGLGTPGQDD